MDAERGDIPHLSTQEKRILRCLVEGDANKIIARKMNILAPDGPEPIEVEGIRRARTISRHLTAVGRRKTDPAALAGFRGRYVIDTSGRRHAFLTDPRALDRLERAGQLAIDDAYSLDR